MSDQAWLPVSLGEIATLEYGAALPADVRTGDEFPVFGSNGEVGRHRVALVAGPGIVVGRKGSVGALAWSDCDFWPIDTTYYVKNKRPADLRWLYWVLSTLGLERLDSSTGVPGLNRNDAYEREFLLPSPSEQRRIAEMLDGVDAAIRSSESIANKLRHVKQGVVMAAMGDRNQNREMGFALVGTPTNGIYKPAHLIGRGTLVVGQTAIAKNRYVIPGLARRAVVTPTELNRFGICNGDVLVSRVFATLDGVGQPGLVGELPEPAVYESNMMRLRFDRAKADPFFVFLSLQLPRARGHIVRQANLSNQASISQKVLTRLPIWLPSTDEQRAISRRVRAIDTRIAAEEAVVRKVSKLRMGLISNLLGGHVRVPSVARS